MRENPLLLPLECDHAAKFYLRMAKNILRIDTVVSGQSKYMAHCGRIGPRLERMERFS